MCSKLTRTSECWTRQYKWSFITNLCHCTMIWQKSSFIYEYWEMVIFTYLMLVIQSNRTCYVNYTDLINIALQMDIRSLKLDFHQLYLVNRIFMILSKEQWRYIRGVKGGLSNELFVHPSMDPSTKFDSSFISWNKISRFQELKNIIKSTNN
jgi:hypothetical protein